MPAAGPFSNVPIYVIAIGLATVVIVPIAYVVLSGFRTTGQIAADPGRLCRTPG